MTIQKYTTGFISCLLLTLASFAIVDTHLRTHHAYPSHAVLFAGILVLALIQLVVQMIFFLHIGRESKLRDLVALAFAITTILTIVGGSLWIMANLEHSDAVPFSGPVSPQTETD